MKTVHVVPELRATHVERLDEWAPESVVLYRRAKWDLGATPLSSRYAPYSLRRLAKEVRGDAVVVELPEPLWMRESLRTAIAILVIRSIARRRARLVSYCIENNDLVKLTGLGPAMTQVIMRLIGRILIRPMGRLAFGTPGAERTYAQLNATRHVETRTLLELPASADSLTEAPSNAVLFVGRLEQRKGVLEAMAACEEIEDAVGISTSIVGDGPLAPEVQAWVESRPDRRKLVKNLEHADMEAAYLKHRILLAPSSRDGRWREQVGLPIKEALSYGLTIVTSAETGLAEWLSANGHSVVANRDSLAGALRSAVEQALPTQRVAKSLPDADGRRVAHDWLLA